MSYWSELYPTITEPQPYGDDDVTYRRAATFLGELATEDWGCGLGWYRQFARGEYRGIDGTASKFADVVADLRWYRSSTPALLMRHVLEHNWADWPQILDNAVASFTERMVLVIFTPMSADYTRTLRPGDPPDIAFAPADLTERFGEAQWRTETVTTATIYRTETLFYLEKP